MESIKKNQMEVINFDKVDLPQFKEVIRPQKGYVAFGEDNQFSQYLISLMNKSPLHASITTQKASMVGGYGFVKANLDYSTMLFLKNINANDMDLEELLGRVAYDLEVFGAFAINPVWSKDRSKISEINYVDVSKLRVQAPDPDNLYPTLENYVISDDWTNERKYIPTWYQGFSTRNKKKASQIWYVKEQRAGVEYYGIPGYIAGIRWMESSWGIGDFHMNNISNSFAPSMLINWPIGTPTDEERNALVARLKGQYQGTGGAGNVVITFSDSPESGPQFTPLEQNASDARFLLLADEVRENIIYSHRVANPILFGIQTPGSLGSKNEVLEALELFQSQYVTPKQNLLEKVFNRLARINGITDNLVIKKYSENFKNVDTNIDDVMNVLTADISPEQKFWVLVQNGYVHDVASKLTGYKEGNILDKPIDVPKSPTVQPNSTFDKFKQTGFNLKNNK